MTVQIIEVAENSFQLVQDIGSVEIISGGTQGPPGTGITGATFLLGTTIEVTVGNNLTNVLIVPGPGTITKAVAYAKVGPTGADLIFDIEKNGTSIWNSNPSNRLKIVAGQNSGLTSSFSINTVAFGDLLTINIDQVGSILAGQFITVELIIN